MNETTAPAPVACRIKHPVTLHAMHWDGAVANATAIIDWMILNDGTARYHDDPPALRIDTDQGTETALPGDWVVLGVTGRFFPQTEDEFVATYEPVTGDASAAEQAVRDLVAEQFGPAINRIADETVAGKLAEVEAAVRANERRRIRELADKTQAVCTGDEGTSFFFSALLQDQAEGAAGG